MNDQYRHNLIKEILRLKGNRYLKKQTFLKFTRLIQGQNKLVKKEGATNHISTFFLPISIKDRSIYLVDHIKAKIWIPPGGHIEIDELPIETVRREFWEELNHRLTTEEVRLFDLSITAIDRPWMNCITHYDFWYLVKVEKIPFKFLKKEFYQGGWFNFNEGLKKINRKSYQKIIKNLFQVL